MFKARAIIVGFAVVMLAAGPAPISRTARAGGQSDESWRKQAPKQAPARPFNLPAAREVKLENGLTLILIEDRRTPLVTMLAGVPQPALYSGATGLPSKVALREAMADLLTEGAGSRTSHELARQVETLGGQVSSFAESDYTVVSAAVISENAEAMVDIFADILTRPSFPESEVALYKSNRLEKLALDRQDPSFLVRENFNRIVYGANAYGIIAPAPEAVRLMTRAAVARFYETDCSPTGSVVILVGDFDTAKMEARARAQFDRWKNPGLRARAGASIRPALPAARRVYLIDRPGSAQADFRVGNLAIAQSDADYFPLLVANAILGADTSSRLFMNIREQKGFAYDVYSAVSALSRGGAFFGGAQTRTEVTLQAIREMLGEFERLRKERVSDPELQNAKNYLTGRFSLALSTQGGIAEEMLQIRMLDLGADYLKDYRARIDAVTADDVLRVARRLILTDRSTIVVVGDATRLGKEISTLGPLVVLDQKGEIKK